MAQIENPMVIDHLWNNEPDTDWYGDATWESILQCISDMELEPDILSSCYLGSKFAWDDAMELLWDDIKPETSKRMIERWIKKNGSRFASIYDGWMNDMMKDNDYCYDPDDGAA